MCIKVFFSVRMSADSREEIAEGREQRAEAREEIAEWK
jgi:hypothetical protein